MAHHERKIYKEGGRIVRTILDVERASLKSVFAW